MKTCLLTLIAGLALSHPAHALSVTGGETIDLLTTGDTVIEGEVAIRCSPGGFANTGVTCLDNPAAPDFDVVVPQGFLLDRVAVTAFEFVSGDSFPITVGVDFTSPFAASTFEAAEDGLFPVEVTDIIDNGPGVFSIDTEVDDRTGGGAVPLIGQRNAVYRFELTFSLEGTAVEEPPSANGEVPLPGAAGLLLAGLAGFGLLRRRR